MLKYTTDNQSNISQTIKHGNKNMKMKNRFKKLSNLHKKERKSALSSSKSSRGIQLK